jgi:hypothetical protein
LRTEFKAENEKGEAEASPFLTELAQGPAYPIFTLAKMMAKVYRAIDSINTNAKIKAN